jgi:hypothetical protein
MVVRRYYKAAFRIDQVWHLIVRNCSSPFVLRHPAILGVNTLNNILAPIRYGSSTNEVHDVAVLVKDVDTIDRQV